MLVIDNHWEIRGWEEMKTGANTKKQEKRSDSER